MSAKRATSGRPVSAALCAALVAVAAVGCRDGGAGPVSSSRSARPPAAAPRATAGGGVSAAVAPFTVTDRLGRRVTFDAPPDRIVSLTPSITEMLFAIGAGDRVVGATRYCNYPPEAERLPRVGGGTMESLNQETILGVEPDLVLCQWDNHEPLLRNLERLGIPVLGLGPETVEELYDQIRTLGRVTGNVQQSAMLVASLQRRVNAVTEGVPSGEGPTVFYQLWDDPLMSAGPNSLIGELLSLAGARNLLNAAPVRYPRVDPEVVVAGNPDVILAPSTHDTPVSVENILKRAGWSEVRAVREERVYLIDGDAVSRCGPRLVDALEEIATALYPEQFPAKSLAADSHSPGQARNRTP